MGRSLEFYAVQKARGNFYVMSTYACRSVFALHDEIFEITIWWSLFWVNYKVNLKISCPH